MAQAYGVVLILTAAIAGRSMFIDRSEIAIRPGLNANLMSRQIIYSGIMVAPSGSVSVPGGMSGRIVLHSNRASAQIHIELKGLGLAVVPPGYFTRARRKIGLVTNGRSS